MRPVSLGQPGRGVEAFIRWALQAFRRIEEASRVPDEPPGVYGYDDDMTLAITHSRGTVIVSSDDPKAVTIPPFTDVPFRIGDRVMIVGAGTGAVTITPDIGVTVDSALGLELDGQYAVAWVQKTGVDAWIAWGALTT